jgi:hypothetical protein
LHHCPHHRRGVDSYFTWRWIANGGKMTSLIRSKVRHISCYIMSYSLDSLLVLLLYYRYLVTIPDPPAEALQR